MAKKINGLRIVYIIVSLLVIGAGLVVTFTLQGASIDLTSTRIVELKKEGCDPAEEAGDEILVIKTEMKYIKGGIDDIKLEQKAMQETAVERQAAVLKAIHAIKEK